MGCVACACPGKERVSSRETAPPISSQLIRRASEHTFASSVLRSALNAQKSVFADPTNTTHWEEEDDDPTTTRGTACKRKRSQVETRLLSSCPAVRRPFASYLCELSEKKASEHSCVAWFGHFFGWGQLWCDIQTLRINTASPTIPFPTRDTQLHYPTSHIIPFFYF